MNEQTNQSKRLSNGIERPGKEGELSWERPEFTLLGRLSDLIQGGGKVGSAFDGDPQGTRKSGVG